MRANDVDVSSNAILFSSNCFQLHVDGIVYSFGLLDVRAKFMNCHLCGQHYRLRLHKLTTTILCDQRKFAVSTFNFYLPNHHFLGLFAN